MLVLCGDHGMSEQGSHGGATYAEVATPLVLISPLWKDSTGEGQQHGSFSAHNGLNPKISCLELIVDETTLKFVSSVLIVDKNPKICSFCTHGGLENPNICSLCTHSERDNTIICAFSARSGLESFKLNQTFFPLV